MADATVFTTSTWPYCRHVKEFLSREGVSYQEKNVQLDRQAAQEMVKLTGQMGVPVTLIGGQAIVGFDQPALKNAVNRLRQQSRPAIKLGAQVADAARVLPQRGQPALSGALLGEVRPGSLAARSGLLPGDIITALNGQPVSGSADLANALAKVTPNRQPAPTLSVRRDGRELQKVLSFEF